MGGQRSASPGLQAHWASGSGLSHSWAGANALGRQAGGRWPCHLRFLSLTLTLKGDFLPLLSHPVQTPSPRGALPDNLGPVIILLGHGARCGDPQSPPMWGFTPEPPSLSLFPPHRLKLSLLTFISSHISHIDHKPWV